MKFYHFTSVFHLAAILKSGGLSKGDVPTGLNTGENGVWLTSSLHPGGHGLTSGEAAGLMIDGKEVLTINKREVRISIIRPEASVKKWMKWGRKNCDGRFFDALNETGGGKRIAESWYIVFDKIPTENFAAVEVRGDTGDWLDYKTVPEFVKRLEEELHAEEAKVFGLRL